MKRQSKHTNSLAVIITVVLGAASLPEAQAQTEVVNPGTGPNIWVHWLDSPDPVLDADFTVSFADEAFPDLELITGSFTWRIWSVDSSNPDGIGDFGDISLDTTVADDYAVRILQLDDDTPGARDVKSIVLTPQSGHFSDIFGAGAALSRISGDVAGDVTVVESGGVGGIIALDILGDLGGHLDAPDRAIVYIGGNVTSTGQISIGILMESKLWLNYDVGLAGYVDGPITVNTLSGSPQGFAYIDIEGDLNDDLTILGMFDYAELTIGGDCSGIITINSGASFLDPLEETSSITIDGELTATGKIDLTGHSVEGTITVGRAGAGDIVGVFNLQELFGQATITLGTVSTDVFSGNLSIVTVGSGGFGLVQIQNLSGDVVIGDLHGILDILGDFTSTGTIDIYTLGTAGELKINSAERTGANAAGVINISPVPANIPFDGSITVFDSTSSTDGDLSGSITVFGTGGMSSTGSIDIQGTCSGTIDTKDDMNGTITVGEVLSGDILLREDFAGTIDVDGDQSGDIRVSDDMSSAATIDIGGELSAAGRIFVDGECDGDIIISERTADLSLIRLRDFGSSGSIIVNDSEGDFDAEGDIYVGSVIVPQDPPPPDVTYDGTILLKKESGTSDGGGLLGHITVVGCHATTDDLDICECGTSPSINVTLTQPTCTNQVDWSCVSGCP